MIVSHGYIVAMNEIDEPCLELNEIIYHITGDFWKQAYYCLLAKQNTYEPEPDLPAHQAVCELRKELKLLAKENKLKCTAFSHNEHFYVSLIPYPIYIGIERETGDFSISAPHISTRHFTHSEYKSGLKWIQDYIDIDIKPLTEKTQAVREKFYLNIKSAEIVTVSIKALCNSILGKKSWKYKLHQTRLRSEIMFQVPDSTVYELEIYHKPFSNDASMLIDLLNNPREVKVVDNVSCAVVHCSEDEIKAMVENLRNVQEAAV